MFTFRPITLLVNRDQDNIVAFDIPRLQQWLIQNRSCAKTGIEFFDGMIELFQQVLTSNPPRDRLDRTEGITICQSNDGCFNVEVK